MGKKVTIIGAGNVGATIGYALTLKGLASEILFVDIATEKALGEAMDIYQATPVSEPVYVHAGSYEEAVDSDIVIITSGLARKPGQTRLELAQTNANIMKSIASQITKYAPNAIYIIVSNPVDILTHVFTKVSGIPESHIIGSGTQLDSARLCATLAEKLGVNQKDVHAYVMGEHGDSSFVPWSLATVAGVKIEDVANGAINGKKVEMDYDGIVDYVRQSGGIVIKRKGATFYAIAASVARIVEMLNRCDNSVAVVSTLLHGEYGMEDVCVSVPCILGPDGVKGKLMMNLTEEETAKLHNSGEVMKKVMAEIDY